VAHRTNDATGVRFVRWDASAGRVARELIPARIHRARARTAVRSIPGEYLG
jgi:hypothetical protein